MRKALSYTDRARTRVLGLTAYLEMVDRGVDPAVAALKACSLHGHDFVGPVCDRCGARRGMGQ